MMPIIALIGRPNVGKSTLFNRLTKTRDALVADLSSLTRDRKYGRAEFLGQEFIIIDTGGIDYSKDNVLNTHIVFQSLLAIKEADVIFFIVDVRSGLMPTDCMIAKYLRSYKKDNIYLLANKIDGLNIHIALSDFYTLGIRDIYPISASHGNGIMQLIKKLVTSFSLKLLINNNTESLEKKINVDFKQVQKKKLIIKNSKKESFNLSLLPIKLAIVGRPNVGKSTLINCILGEKRVIVYDFPGTTRDSIHIPIERDGNKYILIDTAGVRKKKKITEVVEKFSVIKTFQSIKDANIVLLIIDAQQVEIFDQDLSLLSFILNTGRSFIIVVNKWDGIMLQDRKLVKNMLDLRLNFINFAKVHFISALYGNGINGLFKSIRKTYESATRKIGAALLTRTMKMAEKEHYPPLIRGCKVKMKYAHVGGYNPLIVVIHGKQVSNLPDSYRRYLINYFHSALQIKTPIRIQFKDGNNPLYISKNKLKSV